MTTKIYAYTIVGYYKLKPHTVYKQQDRMLSCKGEYGIATCTERFKRKASLDVCIIHYTSIVYNIYYQE